MIPLFSTVLLSFLDVSDELNAFFNEESETLNKNIFKFNFF
jgi:hypothetical protein